jgi:AcrR family transcriptional regulator
MQVFWRKGYEGASLDDLTKAMGINRPSLYATFGDKETLFRKALDRYAEGPFSYIHRALEEKTARQAAEKLLRESVMLVTNPNNPRGCLFVQGALAAGDGGALACRELAGRRQMGVALLRKRFKRAKFEGDLPPDTDPAALARYVATVLNGIAVQAAGGATKRDLERVVQLAMKAWPA